MAYSSETACDVLYRRIFYSCHSFSEIDPKIGETDGDDKNDHILLYRDKHIEKRSENDWDLFLFEEESGDGQPLEEGDHAADDQDVDSDHIQNQYGSKRHHPRDDKQPYKLF